MLIRDISRVFKKVQKVPNMRRAVNYQLIREATHKIRNTMNSGHLTYPLELFFPSETVTLYFSLSKEVGAKDLVATVSCFDAEGSAVPDLKSLPFSSVLSSHYVYLRPQEEITGGWVSATFSGRQPIKHIEVEVVRWKKSFEREIEDVVLGVWAGETLAAGEQNNSVNFVSIRGKK